ncbi:hypothetical protein MOUN0_K08746 [Monosporozyma unispora]|nr:hypothetical protein C6P44_002248 [Kazachstania unispora]
MVKHLVIMAKQYNKDSERNMEKEEKEEHKYPSEPPPSYDETMIRDRLDQMDKYPTNDAYQSLPNQPDPSLTRPQSWYVYHSGHGGSKGFPGSGSQTYGNRNK